MKRNIYGRKVGSKKPFTLMFQSEGVSSGSYKPKPDTKELQQILQFEITNTRRAVKTLRERSIEGYVQFEGDSTKYAFTPAMDFDYPGVPRGTGSEELMGNPYTEGLELVKLHPGTSGQAAMAKCILSLYNREHAFSIAEVLAGTDERYTKVVIAMINEYATRGETAELCEAGRYVYDNFPRIVQLSKAMADARYDVRRIWDREREEEERRLYDDNE